MCFYQELRRFAHFLGVNVKDCLEKAGLHGSMAWPKQGVSDRYLTDWFVAKYEALRFLGYCRILQVSNNLSNLQEIGWSFWYDTRSWKWISPVNRFSRSIYLMISPSTFRARFLPSAASSSNQTCGIQTFDIIIGQP